MISDKKFKNLENFGKKRKKRNWKKLLKKIMKMLKLLWLDILVKLNIILWNCYKLGREVFLIKLLLVKMTLLKKLSLFFLMNF